MDEQAVGANIRKIRVRAGRTLTGLARAAGMTKSALSKIETGRISPSIATLLRVADALGVRLTQFLAEPETVSSCAFTRKGQGRMLTRDGSRFGYSYQALALDMPDKRGEPFLLTIRPGDPVGKFHHGGQEFVYMLSGTLAFTVGRACFTLKPGDSLYFDPNQVHTTKVVGRAPARFLCVFLQNVSPK
ncbi:MAG: XRE family transcriptional regulator [Planctomycetota bacterium]